MQLIAWHGALRKAEKAKRKNNIHNNKNSGLSRTMSVLFIKFLNQRFDWSIDAMVCYHLPFNNCNWNLATAFHRLMPFATSSAAISIHHRVINYNKEGCIKFWYVKVIFPCPYTETVYLMVSSVKQSLDRILISYAQAKLCVKIKPSGQLLLCGCMKPINWGDTQLMQL